MCKFLWLLIEVALAKSHCIMGVANSIEMSPFFIALWVWERVPRMQRSEDRRSEKESLQRIQFIILEYGVSFFIDASDAILLNTILASLPIPPVEENTEGENEPCSMSLTLWP